MASVGEDSRGIVRGQCLFLGCQCSVYIRGGSESCSRCHHPPGRHSFFTKIDYQQSEIVPPQGDKAKKIPIHAEHKERESNSIFSTTIPHSPHSHTCYKLDDARYKVDDARRPTCKASRCINKVYYEPGYKYFDYCSPKCRDEHCLPRNRDKLHKELKVMMSTLKPGDVV